MIVLQNAKPCPQWAGPLDAWYLKGLAADAAAPAIFGFFRKFVFKPVLNLSKSVGNHVKLSFLSAALDPQAGVQRSQIYEGFMPIFRSA